MITEDAEKLAKAQTEAITSFFGADIQTPPDQLFETAEKARVEKLFKTSKPFYLPRRTFTEGVNCPGQKVALSSNIYYYMREKWVNADTNSLPGMWILLDTTKRPGYKDGRQMYPDTKRFKDVLAGLRDDKKIKIPDYLRHVPKDSRFGVSPGEIDGTNGFVSEEIAKILIVGKEQVNTPTATTFNYIGNLAHPEFGRVNTSEWFSNNFGRGDRLVGGSSDGGGLGFVSRWCSGFHGGGLGFRLQVSFPSQDS